jgi:hypothetical protein
VITKARFEQGLTPRQYLDQMSLNRDRMLGALDAIRAAEPVTIPGGLAAARRILVITEDWCGTSLPVLPYVFRLAEITPGLEGRVFLRDANPDIMDQYLKDGRYRSIPVVVFLDEAFTELARFIEQRPA